MSDMTFDQVCDAFAARELNIEDAMRRLMQMGCEFIVADWALWAAREEYDEANSQLGVGA